MTNIPFLAPRDISRWRNDYAAGEYIRGVETVAEARPQFLAEDRRSIGQGDPSLQRSLHEVSNSPHAGQIAVFWARTRNEFIYLRHDKVVHFLVI